MSNLNPKNQWFVFEGILCVYFFDKIEVHLPQIEVICDDVESAKWLIKRERRRTRRFRRKYLKVLGF
jgi:hypothetical protein